MTTMFFSNSNSAPHTQRDHGHLANNDMMMTMMTLMIMMPMMMMMTIAWHLAT